MSKIQCPKCGEIISLDDKEKSIEIARAVANEKEKAKLEKELALQKQQAGFLVERAKMSADLVSSKKEIALSVERAIADEKEKNIRLESALKNKEIEASAKLLKFESERGVLLKYKDDEIERLKNMQATLSTKMIGETLERYCELKFEEHRALAFTRASFSKDNDVSAGTKGDYIFRDYDENGNEILSIMFEMKNEEDKTITKKTNNDFLEKLDKDRKAKKCDYAILVSLLEKENKLYNGGIVDVSHKFPKMYVIRPQFFIPIIGLIRNAEIEASKVKSQLILLQNKNIDVTNFESDLEVWKNSIGETSRRAKDRFQAAITQIDNSIKNLEKTKEELLKSEKHFIAASNKADELTIKKLTKNKPAMIEMFAGLQKEKNNLEKT